MKNREQGMKKLPNAKLNAPKPKLHRVTGRIAEEQDHVASEARQEWIEDLLSTEPTTIAGIAAVLDYVNEPPCVKEDDDKETSLVEEWETSQDAALAFLPMIAARLRRWRHDQYHVVGRNPAATAGTAGSAVVSPRGGGIR
jgi:hypothetical protein